jgi:hypothetical protein
MRSLLSHLRIMESNGFKVMVSVPLSESLTIITAILGNGTTLL